MVNAFFYSFCSFIYFDFLRMDDLPWIHLSLLRLAHIVNHCLENYVKEFLEHRMMSVVPAVFVWGNNNPELPRWSAQRQLSARWQPLPCQFAFRRRLQFKNVYIYSLNLSHTWNDSHQKSHSDVQKLPQLSLFKLPPQMHANGWKMIHWLLTPLTVNSPSNCYPFPCKLVTKIWCFIKIGTSTW